MPCLWAAVLLLIAPVAAGSRWSGPVLTVHDGDTLTVQRGRKRVRIRLVEIDAPELQQAAGEASRQSLAALCLGRTARIRPAGTDDYGRLLARVECRGRDANSEQVRLGWAWFYARYSHDQNLKRLEQRARQGRRGLWADRTPEPPWEYRHRTAKRRQRPGPAGRSGAARGSFRCGSKHYCKEMSGCSEAVYYMKRCGLQTLDGDHDGVPCEALCLPTTPR